MSVQAVFFDVDDTLVDHSTAMRRATVALYRSLELRVDFQEFHSRWRAAHSRHYPRFLRGDISYVESSRARVREAIDSAITDQAADEMFGEYLNQYERGWALLPDVMPCLDKLRHLRLGIISNGRSHEQRHKLDALRIAERFGRICISEELGVAKPDAGIFLKACGMAEVEPGHAMYVGDQYELDACAAASAGLTGVWLNRQRTARDICGVLSINSLSQLPALMNDSRSAGH